MIKKIVVVIISLIITLVLIACAKDITTKTMTTTESPTTISQTTPPVTQDPDLVTLMQVAETITIADSNNITSDFSLLAAYGEYITIAWTSNNPTVVSIASTATTEGSHQVYLVTVNPFTVDTIVILTATFTFNSKVYNKLYTITVKPAAVVEDGTFNLVSKLYEEAKLDDIVSFSGYVSVIYRGGYVMTDTVGNSLIVSFSEENTEMTVKVGDHVTITGKYAKDQSLFQIIDPTSQVINSSNNKITLTPTVLEDALSLKTVDSTNKLNRGKVYTVTVTPIITNSGDVALYKGDTLVAVVYYNSPAASIAALKEFEAREVTINVMYYTLHSTDGVRVLFYGLAADIESEPLTLEQKFAIDTEILDNPLQLTTILELPELVHSEYGSITISTSLTDYLALAGGTFTVTRPASGESDAVGTITVRITIGQEYRDIVINVTIKAIVDAVASDLFISQYIEGGDYNKYIEIYNGTASTVNLSEYTLELYTNGASTASKTMTLTGTLAAGAVVVIYNNKSATILYNGDIVNNDVMNFNGDDAIVLKHNGTIIDSIGQIGTDPGDFWGDTIVATKDMTLIRKSYILSGDTNPNDAFDPSLEWDAYPKDSAEGIGSHTTD